MSQVNLGYFITIVRRDHPTWPTGAIRWQAQRMLERHPLIEKAFNAGKAMGRTLRERWEHGLGLWWAELGPLDPEERGFVLALIKNEIQPRQTPSDGLTLEAVKAKQETEAYEANADALALDWREKSNAADSRVKHQSTIAEAQKPPKARA